MVIWVTSEGCTDELTKRGELVRVTRRKGYVKPGSVACELRDTGNGYIARFPAHSSIEQDKYVCLDYSEARNLVLALSPHAESLGFAEARKAKGGKAI